MAESRIIPLPPHLAPRRADYERVFTGVNLKTDIISGTLFNSSGTHFRLPDSSGTHLPKIILVMMLRTSVSDHIDSKVEL